MSGKDAAPSGSQAHLRAGGARPEPIDQRSPWPVHAADPRILLIPLGSTEQHGPHLPLDTDTRIARAWANATAEHLSEHGIAAVVAPALPVGASGEHRGFAGTLSIGTAALTTVLVELVRSVESPISAIWFLNGHGGNIAAVEAAVDQLRYEGHPTDCLHASVPGGDAHAGRTETSLLLHLQPDVVRLDLAEAGDTRPIADLLPDLRRGGVAAVSPNGVLGDPAGASAEEGAELLRRLAQAASEAIRSAC